MYKEQNSTVTHNGKEYNLNCIIAASTGMPLENLPISDFEWILKYSNPDKKRAEGVDISIPIIYTKSFVDGEWKKVVLDGLHRLYKSINAEKLDIPARYIGGGLLALFEIKPKIDPIQYIKKYMLDNNLKQKDLIICIGSKSRVSEVLSKKRKLNLPMIRKIHKEFGIPLNILISEYK